MAMVSPSLTAIVRKAVFTKLLSGRPKEILDRPHMVARPFPLQYLIVSSTSFAAFGLAPIVATSPSTTMSSLVMPSSSAFSTIISIIAIFSSRFAGSPASERGSRINIAPYFLAIGRSFSSFSDSAEIELISALPGYLLSAASSTST